MTRAKRLRASLCFTTTQPSLRVHSTKPRSHIGKPAKPRKQIDCRGNCENDIQITLADKLTSSGFPLACRSLGEGGTLWHRALFFRFSHSSISVIFRAFIQSLEELAHEKIHIFCVCRPRNSE